MSTLVFLLSASSEHTGKHPGLYCPGGQRSQDAPKGLNERGSSLDTLRDTFIFFMTRRLRDIPDGLFFFILEKDRTAGNGLEAYTEFAFRDLAIM
ncbi:hypothetical protein MHYP_G00350240 [Metynnis hypsauchen]